MNSYIHTGETQKRRAFTLVELLVVIGIIAVLVGILLPALNKARRSAATVQCASNMRQIATAMLMYVNANKGHFPPTAVAAMPGPFPNAWWWPNELVRGKYITTGANVYSHPGSSTSEKHFNSSNVFKCPEGIDDDFGNTSGGGDFPTDAGNNGYSLANDSQCAADGLGVPSWYMLNSRVETGSNQYPNGSQITPFVWFNSTATPADVANSQYQRNMSMVHKASELIMLVESSNANWYDNATLSTKFPTTCFLRRLGARHGKKTADGANAFTNFAFFDGHVGSYGTAQYQPKNHVNDYTQETIFILNRQRGK